MFYTKNRVENVWYHENPNLNCIAVDAQVISVMYFSSYVIVVICR